MNSHINSNNVAIGQGTLNVALATPKFIVVATDSRRTDRISGKYHDKCKKLFNIGRKRILSIAGFIDIGIGELPWLTTQIPPLLDQEIERVTSHDALLKSDDDLWNNIPPTEELPPEFKRSSDMDTYFWWNMLRGPLQTSLNIVANYRDIDPNSYRITGILAGFKCNGEAKLEKLEIIPQIGRSNWDNNYIGIAHRKEHNISNGSLIYQTAGAKELADQVLSGQVEGNNFKYENYPGIKAYIERCNIRTVDNISEHEMISLAKDLIKATAKENKKVGVAPIQIATLRPKEHVSLEQRSFPEPGYFLPPNGTWHLGVNFINSDYPFDQREKDAVFTFCKIKNNKIPIPLGNNHFYGCEFDNVTFLYKGGLISYDHNDDYHGCKLIIITGTEEELLEAIKERFKKIEYTST